ncbi:ATP-binding cassette domain-containing protein, partial [Avibacterium paragallinarum]
FKMLSLHRERIADIALTEIENSIHSSPFSLSEEQKGLSILVKNLTFQYDQFTQPILDNLNLEVNAGESIAISAKSGAGKTTLLKLMSGLLRPTKGEIYINNIDIKNLDSSHYRQHIATVLQEDKFFSGSILENIVCFDNQYDKEFAIQCAKQAQIHNEIMKMPMNYETLLGELGNNLSGGQRQRLFIARALYKRPKILFMDEATSHLDEENERKINDAIAKLKITRVIVAHRQSTIESADRCINL